MHYSIITLKPAYEELLVSNTQLWDFKAFKNHAAISTHIHCTVRMYVVLCWMKCDTGKFAWKTWMAKEITKAGKVGQFYHSLQIKELLRKSDKKYSIYLHSKNMVLSNQHSPHCCACPMSKHIRFRNSAISIQPWRSHGKWVSLSNNES